jgi:hypothetical protein
MLLLSAVEFEERPELGCGRTSPQTGTRLADLRR